MFDLLVDGSVGFVCGFIEFYFIVLCVIVLFFFEYLIVWCGDDVYCGIYGLFDLICVEGCYGVDVFFLLIDKLVELLLFYVVWDVVGYDIVVSGFVLLM